MQKITPFLWFDNNAEEAVNFYLSVFPDSELLSSSKYPEGGPGPAGSLMVASFEIQGQVFNVINGGPHFKFTEAISFVINCDNQEETDRYWAKLSEGGTIQQCGWLKDKFGLSWQVIPTALPRLMSGKDPKKSQQVMQAMMKMKKIVIKDLEEAYAQ